MSATLLTLPRELRDEIYTHAALASSFAFLRACRQINKEATPLIYKYGTYRCRALTLRKEHLPAAPKPSPIAMIQNLYISMPPVAFRSFRTPYYEISLRTMRLLSQFGGTEIKRKVCHFDLQTWVLSARMASVLSGFRGFEVVRVEVRFEPWCVSLDGRIRPLDMELRGQERIDCIQPIKEQLYPALGEATWETKPSGHWLHEVHVAVFQPGTSRE